VWNVKDPEKIVSQPNFALGKQQDPSCDRINPMLPGQRNLVAFCIAIIVIGTSVGLAQSKALGIFTNQGSVGQTPPGCTAHYDSTNGEYRITGGGENVWGVADAFYFVWKKASGDMTLTADLQWVGSSSAQHRKALLMIRQSLDPGSAYADAASHGNGLTSLQFRGAANEQTYQVITQVEGTVRLRIERKGSRFTMYAGKPNEELKPVGPVEYVGLQDPVYVGLGVCSHVATTLETAIFSNVKLEETLATK
jgi:TolB protein